MAFVEDKQEICDLLLETLKATRGGQDIVNLIYGRITQSEENVMVLFANGTHINVNVSMDSGLALVRDVMKKI